MNQATITFLILGLSTYLLGAYSLIGFSMETGKICAVVLLSYAGLTFLYSLFWGKKSKLKDFRKK